MKVVHYLTLMYALIDLRSYNNVFGSCSDLLSVF